jgi:hypothetical protein
MQNSPKKEFKPQIFILPNVESSVSDSDSNSSDQSDDEEVKNKIMFKVKSINNKSRKGSEDIMLVSGAGTNMDSKTHNNFFQEKF